MKLAAIITLVFHLSSALLANIMFQSNCIDRYYTAVKIGFQDVSVDYHEIAISICTYFLFDILNGKFIPCQFFAVIKFIAL